MTTDLLLMRHIRDNESREGREGRFEFRFALQSLKSSMVVVD